MLDLSWKVFSKTGNVDTYLLIKELERESDEQFGQEDVEMSENQDAATH
ncbi:YqzL family protein [Halalkalibacter urbisdiaboli]|nr:YqzL family protein [Halalkalibacter urbisdiaboli]